MPETSDEATGSDAIVNALSELTNTIADASDTLVDGLTALTEQVRAVKTCIEDLATSTENGHSDVAGAVRELTEELKQK